MRFRSVPRLIALLTTAAVVTVPALVAPTVEAAPGAKFTVSPGAGNFGKVTLTASETKTFTVKNTSQMQLVFQVDQVDGAINFGQNLPTTGDGHCMVDTGGDPHFWGVAPGGTCDFEIEYAPHQGPDWQVTYAHKGSFTITAFEAALTDVYVHGPASGALVAKTLKVSGKGVTPKVKINPATVNFGTVHTNGAAVYGTMVTNKSDIPLEVRPTNYAGHEPFEFIFPNGELYDGLCRATDGGTGELYMTILPGESCEVRVLAQGPTGGNHTDQLQLLVGRSDLDDSGYHSGWSGHVQSLVYVKVKVHGSGHPG
ncbi:choice-of-anchor D domain-containing protein [Nocardioides humilatus]|nr:choice-of-anchor D domain-containing protein [Nocardioides humilatus]